MRSSRAWLAGMSWGAWLVVAAGVLRGATACGTQPCFRHSDCASSEVCSNGSCVPAPVDVPSQPIDDGGATDGTVTPVVDSNMPVVDTSMPVVDSGTPVTPDSYEAASTLDADAGADGDAGDSARE